MFVGHYGPSFTAKCVRNSIPLWVLFLAVQLIAVFWSVFVLLGIEKVRIVPGITATNPLDLYYMPYTHSLFAAALWSIGAAVCYHMWKKIDGWVPAGLVGAAVFSHWLLDVLVHRPDMPVYDDSIKIGFGLWNYPVLAFVLELALMFGGMYSYLNTTKSTSRVGTYGMVVFGLIMGAIQARIFFGPPPSSDKSIALTALVSYSVFAGIAYWLDGQRMPQKVLT